MTRPRTIAFLAGLALGASLTIADRPVFAAEPKTWYAPVVVEGKTFPVLRPADGRWLNWRDTYGAPRMRLMPDGVWRQVGVHQGIDIFTEEGAPVVSMTPGEVERVGWTFYSGWRVGVRGSDGKYYFYAHLSSYAPGLAEGMRVSAGQLLGRVGNSGYGLEGTADEFPAHLHLGVQTGARWENPGTLLFQLYQAYVSATRDGERRLAEGEMAARALLGRAYGPGAPPADALGPSISAVRQRLEAIRTSLLASLE